MSSTAGEPGAGEVLAAVEAINRALQNSGHDWHDLAAAVERGWNIPPVALPVEITPWRHLAQECLNAGAGILTAAEIDFLGNIAARLEQPSDKQLRWLAAIAEAFHVQCAA